jgi:hypothetical protein
MLVSVLERADKDDVVGCFDKFQQMVLCLHIVAWMMLHIVTGDLHVPKPVQ